MAPFLDGKCAFAPDPPQPENLLILPPAPAGGSIQPENRAAAPPAHYGREPPPRPPDTYAALLRELNAIGTNINQIAHNANTRKEAGQPDIDEAVKLVRQAYRLVRETLLIACKFQIGGKMVMEVFVLV